DHRVDVLPGDELSVVVEGADLRRLDSAIGVRLLDDLHAIGEALRVEFADRDVVGEIGLDDAGHVVALRDASAADLAYADTAVGTPGPTRNDEGRNRSRDQYIAPRNPAFSLFMAIESIQV